MDIKAGDWIVIENWGYELEQVSAVKPQTVTYNRPGREGRVSRTKVVFSHAEQANAAAVQHKLKSAKGERHRREQAARSWFQSELEKIVAEASA